MAVSIQGGLYATCSYSTDRTTSWANTLDTCSSGGDGADGFSWNDFTLPEVLTYLLEASEDLLEGTCFEGIGRLLQSAEAKTDEYHHETHTYYPGISLVLSGPMHVSGNYAVVQTFLQLSA
jgi:hypothetical protein